MTYTTEADLVFSAKGDAKGRFPSLNWGCLKKALPEGHTKPKQIYAKLLLRGTDELIIQGAANYNKSGRYYFAGQRLPESLPCPSKTHYDAPIFDTEPALIPIAGTVILDPRRTFPREMVIQQWERQGRLCAMCREEVMLSALHGCHIIPWSVGGPTVAWNLAAGHRSCNSKQGNRPMHDLVHEFAEQRRIETIQRLMEKNR